MSADTVLQFHTPEQIQAALEIARTQNEELIVARKLAEAREHQLSNRIQAALVLDLAPEWILSGDPKRPTLWHLVTDAYVSWSGTTDEERDEMKRRIASLRIKFLSPDGPRIKLECFRCTLERARCECCREHRLYDELLPESCGDCARMVAEGIGR